jgi:hypothetical protein
MKCYNGDFMLLAHCVHDRDLAVPVTQTAFAAALEPLVHECWGPSQAQGGQHEVWLRE